MIHILCADISCADQSLYRCLYEKASPGRQQRADRYLHPEDRLRCVAAEALLRTVLGTAALRLEKGSGGKPYLPGREDFHFNLSHSGRYVVLAWGDTELGVDVQKHDPTGKRQGVAKRFFTADEQDYIREDPVRFYEIWTKKESYIKYTGQGLQKDLTSFSVLAPAPGLHYRHCHLEGGYSLSVCAEEDAWEVKVMQAEQLM